MGMKITINGREYDGPEHMPPDVRRLYEETWRRLDKNGNGIPDVIEGPGGAATPGVHIQHQIVVNGRSFGSVEEIPPDLRKIVEAASRVPGGKTTFSANLRLSSGAEESQTGPRIAIEPSAIESGMRTVLWVLAACVAAGVAFVFLMSR